MNVSVVLPEQLDKLTGGENVVEVNNAFTIEALIDVLETRFNGIKERLVNKATGDLNRFLNIYIGEGEDSEDVRFRDGVKTPLNDGDVVLVLPAIAGG